MAQIIPTIEIQTQIMIPSADGIEGHDTNGDGVVNGSDSPNANTGLSGGSTDSDGDGLLDGFDNNTSDTDPTNGSLTAESHPDVQGGTSEQDWREASTNNTASRNDFNNTPYETPVTGNASVNDIDGEGDNQSFTLNGSNGGMNVSEGTVSIDGCG